MNWNNSLSRVVWGDMRVAVAGSVAAVVFGSVVVVASVATATAPIAAQSGTALVSIIPTPEAAKYYLPYPGVLPDSPLYTLKALRDQLSLRLTFGAEAKARRELLFADKRIGAAKALMEGGKLQLAGTTALKAEKYLLAAGNRLAVESASGRDVKSMLMNLDLATHKHKEIMLQIIGATNGDGRQVLEESLKQTEGLQKKLEQTLQQAK